MLNELDELTVGKTLDQLEKELDHQKKQGNPTGGAICSHIIDTINQFKNDKH